MHIVKRELAHVNRYVVVKVARLANKHTEYIVKCEFQTMNNFLE